MVEMSSSAPNHHRPRSSALVACMRCRRLKMKCIGADSLPCQRCRKAGRECVISSHAHPRSVGPEQHVDRQSLGQQDPKKSFNATSGSNLRRSERDQYYNEQHSLTSHSHEQSRDWQDQYDPRRALLTSDRSSNVLAPNALPSGPQLPSIFSMAPAHLIEPTAPFNTQLPSAQTQTPTPSQPIKDQQLLDLVIFFNERLLHNLPFLSDETTHDISLLIRDRRPLAYSAAFVAARFVPGYQKLRRDMIPEITGILSMRHYPPQTSREHMRTLLQSYCVLFAYSLNTFVPVNEHGGLDSGDMRHYALKGIVETFARRMELYRSAEVLQASLRTGKKITEESTEIRLYMLWLWLFTMSHYNSMIFRAPPTIFVDTNIRNAAKILKDFKLSPSFLRILAEVELCLLWHTSTTSDRAAGEWWCSSPARANVEDTLATLKRFETAFHAWQTHWLTQPFVSEGTIFHYKFARFCISTYVTRLTYQQDEAEIGVTSTMSSLSPPVTQLIAQSVEAAAECCSLIMVSTPLQRDKTRYVADTGFLMMAFPCFYIIRAAEMLADTGIPMESHLTTVETVARMMRELAVDPSHGAMLYGKTVLEKLSLYHSQISIQELQAQDHSPIPRSLTPQNRALSTQAEHLTVNVDAAQYADIESINHPNISGNLDPAWKGPASNSQSYTSGETWTLDASIESTADMVSAYLDFWPGQQFD